MLLAKLGMVLAGQYLLNALIPASIRFKYALLVQAGRLYA